MSNIIAILGLLKSPERIINTPNWNDGMTAFMHKWHRLINIGKIKINGVTQYRSLALCLRCLLGHEVTKSILCLGQRTMSANKRPCIRHCCHGRTTFYIKSQTSDHNATLSLLQRTSGPTSNRVRQAGSLLALPCPAHRHSSSPGQDKTYTPAPASYYVRFMKFMSEAFCSALACFSS